MNNPNQNSTQSQQPQMSQQEIYEVIFPLLRTALWGKERFPFVPPLSVDWNTINKELKIQTVNLLPVDILVQADPKHKMHYFQSTTNKLRSWYKIMTEQQNLYALFQKEQIPFAILKGSSADYYYPQPTYRRMGDIDLIVKPVDFDRAFKLMHENGYLPEEEDDQRHIEFQKNGVSIELHRFFSILNNDTAATWLDQTIYEAIDHCTEVTLENFSFPMLPTLENGLVLLCHINQHLEHGLGLRQIIDWMLFVDKELSDTFWTSQFCTAAQKIGLEKLAITVTRMCQIYLGLNSNIHWCQNADSKLCEDLMNYIIEQGNFGQKLGKERNVAINTLNIKSIRVLFATLQSYGINNWTLLQKHPYLKPFAWIYQLYHYIHKGLQREQPFKQLKADVAKSRHQDDLLERLEVTRRKKKIFTPDGSHF